MPKTNCNIIKDLLPSYLDELCSTESCVLLEEHFKECENCKKLYERTKLEMLHTRSSNAKEIDYFKKIKANVSRKNKVIFAIITLLFILLLYCNLNLTLYQYSNSLAMYLNYAFPIIVAGLLFTVLPDYSERLVPNKLKFSVFGIEFVSITYIFGFIIYLANHLIHGQLPFNIPPERFGPWLHMQLYAVAIGLLFAFVATLFLSIGKKAICPALHFLPLGGLALMLEYNRMMGELSSHINISMFVRPYAIFVSEVIALVGLYMLVNRKNHL